MVTTAEILQQLIRFDTTNPPGNESQCNLYLKELLDQAGLETQMIARSPQRANLFARLPGRGSAPPLLLYGHADVVTTAGQDWKHPPFDGVIEDGFLWGRGSLDMKCGLAMMTSALLCARAEQFQPAGDILFLALADEEAGGNDGARFLVEEHPSLFNGVRYAVGEFGGFSTYIGGKKFYPIQVAEKQICWLKATFKGPGGHGSIPLRGGAMAKLSKFLNRLDRTRLPVHLTPVARQMIESMAEALTGLTSRMLRALLNPPLTHTVLNILGERGAVFEPLLSHTCNPTLVQGGEKINVIPSEISLAMDGRLLPGYKPEDLISELRPMAGKDVEFEVVQYDPGPPQTDLGLYDALAGILKEADSQGIPVPLLLSGVTDARFLARLGIQSYGFLPMNLPADFNFVRTIHAADERIPVSALEFGAAALYELLHRYQ
jgi:acetylornithine deacetylase/succinyl-diaminopimelate desuccinylase-like protein